jgi:hypothetical protein
MMTLPFRRNMRDLLRSGMETNKRRVAKFPRIGNELAVIGTSP